MDQDIDNIKIKLWAEDKYVYAILHGHIYMNEQKDLIYFVRLPTDNESNGFYEYCEPDFLDLEISEDESNLYVISHTFTIKEFKDIIKNFEGLIK